jgi:hypothetical protein
MMACTSGITDITLNRGSIPIAKTTKSEWGKNQVIERLTNCGCGIPEIAVRLRLSFCIS